MAVNPFPQEIEATRSAVMLARLVLGLTEFPEESAAQYGARVDLCYRIDKLNQLTETILYAAERDVPLDETAVNVVIRNWPDLCLQAQQMMERKLHEYNPESTQ